MAHPHAPAYEKYCALQVYEVLDVHVGIVNLFPNEANLFRSVAFISISSLPTFSERLKLFSTPRAKMKTPSPCQERSCWSKSVRKKK
jgi:hypothetical protein